MESIKKDKDKYLSYYKTKFKDHFSPAILDYHLEKVFNDSINTYNKNKGSFSTHLASNMGTLNRIANNKGSLIKETEYAKTMKNKISGIKNELTTLIGKEPTPDEIAKELGISVDKVNDVLQSSDTHAAIVHGLDVGKENISANSLLSGLSGTSQKVLETINKNMDLDKAMKHTGLKKSKYYEERKKIENKLKSSYINHLRNYIGSTSS